MGAGLSEIRGAAVDTRRLLVLLGENLYSSPLVVLRELVQNAQDSITRRRLEDAESPFEPRVDVVADPVGRTLRVRDNGAGLSEDEIHRYLATIGSGYTHELRSTAPDAALIGQFGLGFLSCYVVSDRVEVTTTSFLEPERTRVFRSADGLRYSVTEAPARAAVGTEVVLHLARAFYALSEPAEVQRLLDRYARLLPHPVFSPRRVNLDAVPWRQERLPPPTHWIRIAAGFTADPVAAFPVTPAPGVEVRGMLWVNGVTSWATSDQRRVELYVRGMFVSDAIRVILPEWAGFVGGVVECDALVPTASREDVQRDATFGRLQRAVANRLIEGLCALPGEHPEAWRRVVMRHADALRGAAVADDRLLAALGDDLPVPTTEGDLTLPELAARGALVATTGDDVGHELLLHRALGRPVIEGTRFGALALARRWAEPRGVPVRVLGDASDAAALFPSAGISATEASTLQSLFGDENVRVVPTRFEPPSVAVLWVPDRDVLLKRAIDDDDADRRISAGALALLRSFASTLDDGPAVRLYVNVDAPIVQRLLAQGEPARARATATILRSFALSTGRRSTDDGSQTLVEVIEAMNRALMSLLG